jgi:hypothetical protein
MWVLDIHTACLQDMRAACGSPTSHTNKRDQEQGTSDCSTIVFQEQDMFSPRCNLLEPTSCGPDLVHSKQSDCCRCPECKDCPGLRRWHRAGMEEAKTHEEFCIGSRMIQRHPFH